MSTISDIRNDVSAVTNTDAPFICTCSCGCLCGCYDADGVALRINDRMNTRREDRGYVLE